MTENTDKSVLSDVLPLDLFKPKSIPAQSEEFLTQLAKDIAMNKVFTSDHIRREEWDNILGMVFMPIVLGAFSEFSEEARKDIGMVYEYYDKAGPRSINGYPIFFSFAMVNVKDRLFVWDKYEKIQEALKSV
jgi:hypothetical protein